MSVVLATVLLTVAVIVFVMYPIVTNRAAPVSSDDHETSESEAKRRVALLALRDVEYDREMGKLDEEDYRSLRREISAEALAAIEAVERSREPVMDPVEEEIARARAGLERGTACASCGHVNAEGSRFCSSCGASLDG